MNINISLWNCIKICAGISLTKIVWDTSTIVKEYLTDRENLYKISRSIEHSDVEELPDDEIGNEIRKVHKKGTKAEPEESKLDKIGFTY